MALYEQFTIPYNCYVDSDEVAAGVPRQHGTRDCHYTYASYTIPSTLASAGTITRRVKTNAKPSSSIGSLGSCSAVVNMDEAQRIRTQEATDESSPSMKHEDRSSDKKVPKDEEKDVNETSDRFRKSNDGSAGGAFNTRSLNVMERCHVEATTNCEALASAAGSQLSGPEIRETELNGYTDVLKNLRFEGSELHKSYGRSAECHPLKESIAECPRKSGVVGQGDVPFTSSVADVPFISTVADAKMQIQRSNSLADAKMQIQKSGSPCDKMNLSIPASIKPKDVIHVVGQHQFWKARKAILRQQEIFSSQVFELHKLTMVQKLLAKMPSTLIDDHMLLETASDKHGRGHKRDSDEQGNLADRRDGALAPKIYGAHTRGSKAERRSVPFEESEGQVVGAGVHTKNSFHNSTGPQVWTNTSFGQPCQSLHSDGMSAWGYPMRPYPPGAVNFSSGSAYGGTYVIGPNPQSMAPFTFPCYGQRPEQTSAVCPNNRWPSTMYHNVFLSPAVNEWFAMNHHGQVPPASGSEKGRPANSAPSINMKAEAFTRSAQPSVVPCLQLKFGTSSRMRSLGSYATANGSRLPNSLPRKAGSGNVGEQDTALSPDSGSVCVPKTWEAFGGRNKDDTDIGGQVKGVQERSQLPTTSSLPRPDRMGVDNSSGGYALNLFPLQPSSSMGGYSVGRVSHSVVTEVARHDEDCQGRVIKAVPRSALAASESTAGILLSIQRERQL